MDKYNKFFHLETLDGSIKLIPAPSAAKTEEFRSHLNKLLELIKQPFYTELSLSDVWEEDKLVRAYCEACLATFGISLEDITLDYVWQLLFPYPDKSRDVWTTQGDLCKFLYGEVSEKRRPVTRQEMMDFATLMGKVYSVTNSLDEMMTLVENFSEADIAALLEVKANETMSDEQRHKKKVVDKARELRQKMEKEIQEKRKQGKNAKPKEVNVFEVSEEQIRKMMDS